MRTNETILNPNVGAIEAYAKIFYSFVRYELGCFYKHYLWPFAFNVSQWKIYECLFLNCLFFCSLALNFNLQANFYVYFVAMQKPISTQWFIHILLKRKKYPVHLHNSMYECGY